MRKLSIATLAAAALFALPLTGAAEASTTTTSRTTTTTEEFEFDWGLLGLLGLLGLAGLGGRRSGSTVHVDERRRD